MMIELAPVSRTGPSTVLLVDDEPIALGAMERVLSRAGFHVLTAPDGRAALDRLAEGRADVLVSDISMPRRDGLRLLRDAHIHDPELPVVLLTGHATLESAVTAIDLGAYRYLMKPVTPDELVSVVKNACRHRRLAILKAQALVETGLPSAGRASHAHLTQAFEQALSSMRLHFQPIIDVKTGRVHAHEILFRPWERAFPGPGGLIDAARTLDRRLDLGRAVRAQVASALERHPGATALLHIGADDLEDEELLSGRSPLSPFAGRVLVQPSLSEPHDVAGELPERGAALRSWGFRFALGDAGLCCSVLMRLAGLQPALVRIAPSLVRGIEQDPIHQRIVTALVRICADMDVRASATGVETTAERDTLVALGCHLLQGNLLTPPGPVFPAPAG